jgi:hypothetical protein
MNEIGFMPRREEKSDGKKDFGFGANQPSREHIEARIEVLNKLNKAERCMIQLSGEAVEIDAKVLKEALDMIRDCYKGLHEVIRSMKQVLNEIPTVE